LAAFHDLADPGRRTRAETLSRLPPISALRRPDVPQRAVSARPAGHRRRSIFTFSLTLGDYIIPQIVGNSQFFIGQAVYSLQGTAGNIPLAAAFTVVPIVVMGIYFGSPGAWGPSMRSDRSQSAPFGLKIAAAAGLIFLHLPILLIFVYAFTTEENPTSGRRRRCAVVRRHLGAIRRVGSAGAFRQGRGNLGDCRRSGHIVRGSRKPDEILRPRGIRCWSFCR
jgi:hypothetical protein